MSYDLEKVNKQIESVLSGNGSFDDLRALQAEKADILDRRHLDNVRALQAEIEALKAQRVADFRAEETLQSQLEAAALEVDRQAEILLQAREAHGEINGKLFLLRISDDGNKQAIKEKQAELALTIDKKLHPDNYDESGNLKRVVETNE